MTNLSEGHVHWLDTHSASPYKHSEALLQVPLAPSSERKHLYKYEYSTLNCSAFSEISSKPKSSLHHEHLYYTKNFHLYKYEYSALNCSAFSEILIKPKSSVHHDHLYYTKNFHLYKYEYSALNCCAFSEILIKLKSSVQHDHI